MLERIQIILKLKNSSYDLHLDDCSFTTLETRRMSGYQTEMLKIFNIYENIDINVVFTINRTRQEDMKLL